MTRASLPNRYGRCWHVPDRWKSSCLWTAVLLLWCTLVTLASCSEERNSLEAETATLHFTLGVPEEITAGTRGVSDDPRNEAASWTDWERLVDGRYLYRVTLLLVDRNKTLVGYKDWDDELSSSTSITEVEASFGNLTPGATYTIYALANYSPITANDGGTTTRSYYGLNGFPTIEGLEVGSNVAALLASLQNYSLDAGTDLVAPRQPQALTLVKEVTFPSGGGIYEVEGELIRTYARLRIEVANRSDRYDLKVNGLTFGNGTSKFGYQTEPLFMVTDNQIPVANGNLDAASTDAVTLFSPLSPLEVPRMNTTGGVMQNAKVAFDAYLYECKNTAGFEYALNLGYNGTKTTEKTVYEITGDKTNSPQSGKYLIGYGSSNYFLTAGSDIEGTKISTDIDVETQLDVTQYKQHVWIVTVSGSTITVQSEYNGKYINIGSSDVSLGDDSSLTLSSGKISKVVQGWLGRETTYYIQANNSGGISSTSSNSNGTAFTFYPLTKSTVEETESMEAKDYLIPMGTLIDGVPHTTSIIRRNDFINVLVTVSYNENTGTMDFHVQDWIGNKGGEIEFD